MRHWSINLKRKYPKSMSKKSFIGDGTHDQVSWHNMKWFFSYSKNHICKFMQFSLSHYQLINFNHLSWKEQKYHKNLSISRAKRAIWKSNFWKAFIVFGGVSLGEKKLAQDLNHWYLILKTCRYQYLETIISNDDSVLCSFFNVLNY